MGVSINDGGAAEAMRKQFPWRRRLKTDEVFRYTYNLLVITLLYYYLETYESLNYYITIIITILSY